MIDGDQMPDPDGDQPSHEGADSIGGGMFGDSWLDFLPDCLTWDHANTTAEHDAMIDRLSERFAADRPIWGDDDNAP